MSESKLRRLLFKVAFAVTGFIAGGYAAFWFVELADAVFPPPNHPRPEPEAGVGPALPGLIVGIPLGALIGCALAVVYADTVAAKISEWVSRLQR